MTQLAFLEISLALALLFYGVWRDGSAFVSTEGLGLVVACIILDVAALVYAATFVQPVAALIQTVIFQAVVAIHTRRK